MGNRVTIRRNVEQARNCLNEALSVLERGEDARCAIDDMKHAAMLIKHVVPQLREGNNGASLTDAEVAP